MVAGNQAIRASLERVPARDARWDGHPADMTARVGIEGAMDTHHGRESDDVVRRGRHVERLEILLPGYVDRVVWSAARVRAERCRALRRLLRWAVGPPHRLGGLSVVGSWIWKKNSSRSRYEMVSAS